jgi:nicotinamidase-related amidase
VGRYDVRRGWRVADLVPERVVEKTGYSAAAALPTDIMAVFTDIRIVGMDTDACVLATALGLFDLGLPVTVDTDLVASGGGPDLRAAGLTVLRRQLGHRRVY